MKLSIFSENRKGGNLRKYEAAFLFLCFFLLAVLMRDLLFFGKRIFSHDTMRYFGLMQYFYNSLLNGVFPYWDIYNYCGQPFYYNLGIAKVMEITTVLIVFINKLFNFSLLSLYHWDYFLKITIYSIGVYLALVKMNKFVLSNFLAFLAFIFSSFTLSALRQPGLLTSFCFSGWIMWFLLKLKEEYNLYNMVGFSLFLGLSLTSYQAGYVLTFFQVFILTFILNDRVWLRGIFCNRQKLKILGAGFLIILALSLQLLAVFMEKDRSVPTLRQIESGKQNYSYQTKAGGSPHAAGDYLGLVLPPLAIKYWMLKWPVVLSEATLYIGILPFFFAVSGMIFARNRFKLNFLLLMLAVVFLSLDGKVKLGFLENIAFPFLKYARNMEIFQPFFIFTLIYFVGQGTDVLLTYWQKISEEHS